jgi:hypothetical protein
MDETTLTRLLTGEHLNMTERLERGLWPHPPIPLETVLQHLTNLIKRSRWFPREPDPTQTAINEYGTIERLSDGRFVYRSQRAQPWNPRLLAGSMERPFSTAREAAEFYLRRDLNLPGDLDGWKVV